MRVACRRGRADYLHQLSVDLSLAIIFPPGRVLKSCNSISWRTGMARVAEGMGTMLRTLPHVPSDPPCLSYRPKNCDWHIRGAPIMVVLCPTLTRLAVAWLSSRAPSTHRWIHPGALGIMGWWNGCSGIPEEWCPHFAATPATLTALPTVLPTYLLPRTPAGGGQCPGAISLQRRGSCLDYHLPLTGQALTLPFTRA